MDGYFTSSLPRNFWHRTMDLLTVHYFQLINEARETLCSNNAGEQTGLSKEQMQDPKLLLDTYREVISSAVRSVFETPLRARSTQ